MENNALFQYIKLIVENSWTALGALALIWLWLQPNLMEKLSRTFSKLKFGDFEIELRELKTEMAAAKQEIEVLENDLAQHSLRFYEIAASFDPNAPVQELEGARNALKALAAGMQDVGPVLEGIRADADPATLYAAAEVLRARPDLRHFDALVCCLHALARDPNLKGIRLHTVWSLTSALHKLAMAAVKPLRTPSLTREQLIAARQMLDDLMVNARVLVDRPDNPDKGVRGPARWARIWIERGLDALA